MWCVVADARLRQEDHPSVPLSSEFKVSLEHKSFLRNQKQTQKIGGERNALTFFWKTRIDVTWGSGLRQGRAGPGTWRA